MRQIALTALVAALALTGCGARERRPPDRSVTPPALSPATVSPAPAAITAAGDLGARLRVPVQLRAAPAGQVLARLRTHTGFGSPLVLAVVKRRPGWLGVISAQGPNGRVGWISEREAELVSEPTRVRISLRRRELRVVRERRTILRFAVAIGAPATPTPSGRFAITDGLHASSGSPYGCCVLALSAHQPNVSQGWTGGDRIAVHGTTEPASIGRAVSHGCLRASDYNVRRLLSVTHLGGQVVIEP